MDEPFESPLWSRLWSDAPAGLSEALLAHASARVLRDGEWLYAKGDRAAGLIGVRRGVIRNVNLAADGRELLFGLFPAGSWFGEISLFDDAPRPLHAIAMGETEVLIVPAPAFHSVLQAHPEGYRHFARLLCHKLRVAFEVLENQQGPLRQHLAHRLADLASVYGEQTAEGLRIGLALPQEELARMLGATRQSINKELRAFAAEGLLTLKAGRIVLANLAALKTLARAA